MRQKTHSRLQRTDPKRRKQQDAEMRKKYEAGTSVRELVQEYRVGSETPIRNALMRAGTVMRLSACKYSRALVPRNNEMRTKYEAGASIADLAQEYDFAEPSVYLMLRKAGTLFRRGRPPGQSPELVKRVAELQAKYEAGSSLQDLGQEYDIVESRVRRLLQHVGTVLRPIDMQARNPELVQRNVELRTKYEAGTTITELCEAYALSRDGVRYGLKRAGLVGCMTESVTTTQVMAARAAEMEALYRSGQTLKQVGACFNVSRERVHQILKAHGVSGHVRPSLDVLVEKAIEQYGTQIQEAFKGQRPSREKVAGSLGISVGMLNRIMNKLNVVPTGPIERQGPLKYSKEMVITALTGARTMTEAAKKLGLSYQSSLYPLVHKYGLYDLAAQARGPGNRRRIVRKDEVLNVVGT